MLKSNSSCGVQFSSRPFRPARCRKSIVAATGDDEWYTPEVVIAAAREALGEIDLDPASNEVAQRFVRASVYYNKMDDGLSRQWSGRVFMNPPFSRKAGKAEFVLKLEREYLRGSVTAAVVVTPIDTSYRWGEPIRRTASAICLTRGNLKYHKGDPGDRSIRPHGLGSCISYFGNDVAGFLRAFESRGVGKVWRAG